MENARRVNARSTIDDGHLLDVMQVGDGSTAGRVAIAGSSNGAAAVWSGPQRSITVGLTDADTRLVRPTKSKT